MDRKKNSIRKKIWLVFLYTVLILGAVTSLLPFIWMLSGSLKTNNELFAWPIDGSPIRFIGRISKRSYRRSLL